MNHRAGSWIDLAAAAHRRMRRPTAPVAALGRYTIFLRRQHREDGVPAEPRCVRGSQTFHGGRKGTLCVLLFCVLLIGLDPGSRAGEGDGGSAGVATLPAPLLLHPEDDALISPVLARSGVLFSWVAVPGAISYRLEWVFDGSANEVTVTETTHLMSLPYPSGTRVAWRVTAIHEAGPPGVMSETRAFFIESGDRPTPTPQATPTPPAFFLAPPQLAAPEDGAQFSAEEVRQGILLEWTAVAGSFGYRVNFTVDGIPQLPQHTGRTSSVLSLEVDHAVTVRWAVQALGGSGQAGNSSTSWSFHVAEPSETPTPVPVSQVLDPPHLLSPSDQAWIQMGDALSGVEFSWSEVTGAASYVLQVRRGEAPEIVRETGEPSISVLFATIEEVDLLWAVTTVNAAGVAGPYSPPRAFRIRFGEPGDLDLTGTVGGKDLFLFSSMWGSGEDDALLLRADLDGDGFVTGSDLLLFRTISGH